MLIPALMDFGTVLFQHVWAQTARDGWCLIIQDEFGNITLMWLLRFQSTFLRLGISHGLTLSYFYKWEHQDIEKLLDFDALVKVWQNLHAFHALKLRF